MGRCNSDGSDLHELGGIDEVRAARDVDEARNEVRDVRKADSQLRLGQALVDERLRAGGHRGGPRPLEILEDGAGEREGEELDQLEDLEDLIELGDLDDLDEGEEGEDGERMSRHEGDAPLSSLWITAPLFDVRDASGATDEALALDPALAGRISERVSELASELLAQASASFYVSLGEALAQATEDGTLEAAVARARVAFEDEGEGEGDALPIPRCAAALDRHAQRVSAPPCPPVGASGATARQLSALRAAQRCAAPRYEVTWRAQKAARKLLASGAENGPTHCQRPIRTIVLRRLPDAGPN